MQCNLSTLIAALLLLMTRGILGTDWIDYSDSSSNVDTVFNDDSDQYVSALTRDGEEDIYSPFITGFKYVSGGAGEGEQHLSPSGQIPNHPEVKTDEELASYCDPPNPCPLGFEADDCDTSPMSAFTAGYSRLYQTQQNCHCDTDHDKCSQSNIFKFDKPSNGILKRSRRLRRDARSKQQVTNASKIHSQEKGQTLRFHVANKSPNNIIF